MSIRKFALLVAALGIAQPALSAGNAERGRLLYETFCNACHDHSVHRRESRLARTPGELQAQVLRWQYNAELKWEAQDVQDVSAYLEERYYKFR